MPYRVSSSVATSADTVKMASAAAISVSMSSFAALPWASANQRCEVAGRRSWMSRHTRTPSRSFDRRTASAIPGAIHGAPSTSSHDPETGLIATPSTRRARIESTARATPRARSCSERGIFDSARKAGSASRAATDAPLDEGSSTSRMPLSDTLTQRAPKRSTSSRASPEATRWIPVGLVIADP